MLVDKTPCSYCRDRKVECVRSGIRPIPDNYVEVAHYIYSSSSDDHEAEPSKAPTTVVTKLRHREALEDRGGDDTDDEGKSLNRGFLACQLCSSSSLQPWQLSHSPVYIYIYIHVFVCVYAVVHV